MNKKLLITLGISLALNFFFIGFEVSGALYRPCRRFPPARPEFAAHAIPEKFGAHERDILQKPFKDAFKNHGKEMKNAMKNVNDALTKEPFNVEEFKAALQKAAEIRQTVDNAVQESMVETIAKMSPEERRRFAKHFTRKGNASHHHKAGNRAKGDRHGERHARPLPPPPPEENEADE